MHPSNDLSHVRHPSGSPVDFDRSKRRVHLYLVAAMKKTLAQGIFDVRPIAEDDLTTSCAGPSATSKHTSGLAGDSG